jgi:hypothetical protein
MRAVLKCYLGVRSLLGLPCWTREDYAGIHIVTVLKMGSAIHMHLLILPEDSRVSAGCVDVV